MNKAEGRRRALENVVRISSKWGYELAENGLPYMEPTLIFNADGSLKGIKVRPAWNHRPATMAKIRRVAGKLEIEVELRR